MASRPEPKRFLSHKSTSRTLPSTSTNPFPQCHHGPPNDPPTSTPKSARAQKDPDKQIRTAAVNTETQQTVETEALNETDENEMARMEEIEIETGIGVG